jgi:hypothetical protein
MERFAVTDHPQVAVHPTIHSQLKYQPGAQYAIWKSN